MSDTNLESVHKTVLLQETVDLFEPLDHGLYVDATLGMGGHTEAVLERSERSRVIAIDQDADAIKLARTRLERFGDRLSIHQANFSEIKEVIDNQDWGKPDGIIADLGVSSFQLDSPERGFSFRFDAPLDMRMDPEADIPTAAELLKELSEKEIADILFKYGDERASRKIARWIVERRDSGDPIVRTKDLGDLVYRAIKPKGRDKTHPATRTFQALRIAVNREIDVLSGMISDAIEMLAVGGVLAVITFHSLEDRLVKRAFLLNSGRCFCPPRLPVCMCGAIKTGEVITRKPIIAGEVEVAENPRSRSAKLRGFRKTA